MLPPVWIPRELTLALHLRQLAEHGGGAGIRDEGLLDSALQHPKNKFEYESPDFSDLAAAYAYGFAKNHAFVDGNKRTAFVVSFTFLFVNGLKVTSSQDENTRIFMGLAAGDIDESQLAVWFRKNVAPR
jgi:death on curing protein